MEWQYFLLLISVCILVTWFLVVAGWFVYGQLSGYLTIRKIERMYNQEIARVNQEVMAEWLRERGVSEE